MNYEAFSLLWCLAL